MRRRRRRRCSRDKQRERHTQERQGEKENRWRRRMDQHVYREGGGGLLNTAVGAGRESRRGEERDGA